jgi:hypothetical protein
VGSGSPRSDEYGPHGDPGTLNGWKTNIATDTDGTIGGDGQ